MIQMRGGRHTVSDGFSESGWTNPTVPRHYNMDNGEFDSNMIIDSVEIIFTATQSAQLDFGASPVFFVVARTEDGATPINISTESVEAYGLRLNDPNIIAWGLLNAGDGGSMMILDSGSILPQDMYVNAWSRDPGGSIVPPAVSLGYMIKMTRIKQSGTEALLQSTISAIYEQD